MVGQLYAEGDARRDAGFTIFYSCFNFGAFLAPLVCGYLAENERFGWHLGFGAAGVGMVLGLLIYVLFQNQLPVEPLPTKSKSAPVQGILAYLVSIPIIIVGLIFLLTVPVAIKYTIAIALFAGIAYWLIRLPSDERPRVIAICVACFIVAAFWAVYEQQGNTLQLWADANTRWPSIGGWQIPSTWYQAFNPFMIWFVTPALTALWAWQATRKQEPSSLQKMGMGLIMLGLGFVIMIVAAKGMGSPDAKRSILWLVSSTLIYTLGELYLSPIGLSFVTKVAPQRIVSMMMGVWFLANFIGNYMTGYLGTFYEKMPKDQFFLMLTSIAVIAGVILLLMSKSLDKVVSAHDRQEA
jgi:POT family proton-dependent oligopeptide transporter